MTAKPKQEDTLSILFVTSSNEGPHVDYRAKARIVEALERNSRQAAASAKGASVRPGSENSFTGAFRANRNS
jgi:hypothetical protein